MKRFKRIKSPKKMKKFQKRIKLKVMKMLKKVKTFKIMKKLKKNEEINTENIRNIIFHYEKYCKDTMSRAFMENIYSYNFGIKEHATLIKNILENIHLLFDYDYEKDKLYFHYDNIEIKEDEVTLKTKVRIEESDEDPKYYELNFIFNFKNKSFTKMVIKNYKYKEKSAMQFKTSEDFL